MQEFILGYVLPGLFTWLMSFRWKEINFLPRFALFCLAWPFGTLLITVMSLAALCESYLVEPWLKLEKLLMTDIFNRKEND